MNKIDAKDRRILHEIDLNARIGTSALGKQIGLSQEGSFYRLSRLEKQGIITRYMALLNFARMGYTGYGVYARFQNVTQEQKARIIKELKENDHIYWIAEFGGKYDLAFALMAKNIVHFNGMFTLLATRYADKLQDMTVSIRVELIQFPRDYLINKKRDLLTTPKKTPGFGGSIESESLNKTDQTILSNISNNARISALELANKIGKPTSTVSARLKQLEKRGIIQAYSAQIQCQRLGYHSYQLFITANNLTIKNKQRLLSYCRSHPNIIFYIQTVGKWNFEIIYEIENERKLQDLIIEIRTKFADVITDVESIVLFDHYVKYNQYPLRSG